MMHQWVPVTGHYLILSIVKKRKTVVLQTPQGKILKQKQPFDRIRKYQGKQYIYSIKFLLLFIEFHCKAHRNSMKIIELHKKSLNSLNGSRFTQTNFQLRSIGNPTRYFYQYQMEFPSPSPKVCSSTWMLIQAGKASYFSFRMCNYLSRAPQ